MKSNRPFNVTTKEIEQTASGVAHREATWRSALESSVEGKNIGHTVGDMIGERLATLVDGALLLGDSALGLELGAILNKINREVAREVNRTGRRIDREIARRQ